VFSSSACYDITVGRQNLSLSIQKVKYAATIIIIEIKAVEINEKFID